VLCVQERSLEKEKLQVEKVQEVKKLQNSSLEPLSKVWLHVSLDDKSNDFLKFVERIIKNMENDISTFEGGRIMHFYDQWTQTTSDPEILRIVTGIELEFTVKPVQKSARKQCKSTIDTHPANSCF
jgi:hypothetical protein